MVRFRLICCFTSSLLVNIKRLLLLPEYLVSMSSCPTVGSVVYLRLPDGDDSLLDGCTAPNGAPALNPVTHSLTVCRFTFAEMSLLMNCSEHDDCAKKFNEVTQHLMRNDIKQKLRLKAREFGLTYPIDPEDIHLSVLRWMFEDVVRIQEAIDEGAALRDPNLYEHIKDAYILFTNFWERKVKRFTATSFVVVSWGLELSAKLLEPTLRCLYTQSLSEQQLDFHLHSSFIGNVAHFTKGWIKFVNKVLTTESPTFAYFWINTHSQDMGKIVSDLMKFVQAMRAPPTSTIDAMFMDALSEIGPAMISRLNCLSLLPSLIYYSEAVGVCNQALLTDPGRCPLRAKAWSKCGRAAGRLYMVNEIFEMTPVFAGALTHMEKAAKSKSPAVRASWGWAFGQWTDRLATSPKAFVLCENKLTLMFDLISAFGNDVLKVRYNAWRAAGNVFRMLPASAGNDPKFMACVRETCRLLVKQVGVDTDYQARWNAAFALGCLYGNSDVADAVLTDTNKKNMQCLATWVLKSQNLKERIQCAIAIGKVQNRKIFDVFYAMVFERLCQTTNQLPMGSDEHQELVEKLKIEVVLSLSNMTTLMGPEDLPRISNLLGSYGDTLHDLFESAWSCLLPTRKDVVHKAWDRLRALRSAKGWNEAFDALTKDLFRLSISLQCIYIQEQDEQEKAQEEGAGPAELKVVGEEVGATPGEIMIVYDAVAYADEPEEVELN